MDKTAMIGDEEFVGRLNESIQLSKLDPAVIATHFHISTHTLNDWRDGYPRALPDQLMRRSVLDRLEYLKETY